MKNHHITTTYNPTTNNLDLQYDSAVRNLFQTIVTPVREFMSGQTVRVCDEKQIQDFTRGLEILTQLATQSSLRVKDFDADLAFELVAWSSPFLAQDRPTAELFSRVILLLADVTFIPLSSRRLPPVSEVFDVAAVPREVLQSYETLRLWKGPSVPILTTRQSYDLGFHLKRITPLSADLNVLVSVLGISTLFFRTVISNLAHVALTAPETKGGAS